MMFPVPVDVRLTLDETPSAFRLIEVFVPNVSIPMSPAAPVDFIRIPPIPVLIILTTPKPVDRMLNAEEPCILKVTVSNDARLTELELTINFPVSANVNVETPDRVWSTVKFPSDMTTFCGMSTSVVKLGSAISGVYNIASSSVGAIFRTTAPVPVAVVPPVPPFATWRVPRVISNVPVVVMVAEVELFTSKKPPAGTDIRTEETPPPPPPPEGVCHDRLPAPLVVRTCPFEPLTCG